MAAYIGLSPTLKKLKEDVDGFISSQTSTRTIDSNSSILTTDGFIFASGNTTLTLPSANSSSGIRYYIKNIGNDAITIITTNGEFIDDNSSITLAENNSSIGIVSDNTSWSIF